MSMDDPTRKNTKKAEKALTCIREAYTLTTTSPEIGELDEIMVRQFLNDLAEVALSIASR
jgi:hypothetical protein